MKLKSFPFLAFFFVFAIQFSFAKEEFSFEVSAFAGIKYGELSKSIYLNDTDTKVSMLEWEEKPIYELGFSSEISFFNFYVLTSFSAGLPLEIGKMYDSDWNLNGLKTTYTISEETLNQSFDTQINLFYKTPKFFIFRINPSMQVQYMFQNFTAHDGYGWYGAHQYAKVPRDYDVSWNNELARKAKKIQNIDYYRHTLLTFVGFDFCILPIEKLELSAGFFISPIAYMYSLDTHHKSSENIHYCDVQTGYFSKYKVTANIGYKINRKFKIFMDFSAVFGKEDYGDLYADEYSDNLSKFSNQPTSSTLKNIDFNLGMTFKIK